MQGYLQTERYVEQRLVVRFTSSALICRSALALLYFYLYKISNASGNVICLSVPSADYQALGFTLSS